MKRSDLTLKGAKLITPRIFPDKRGFFFESYRESVYRDLGLPLFVQDNHSYSKKGVIRGMHFQNSPKQAKLVRVAVGKIYDVIVDIRPSSPSYRKWEAVYLDDEKHHQLFVPEGFAHGFQVVSESAHVLYKVSSPYEIEKEKAFRFNDPEIGIEWPLLPPILSDRDLRAPPFQTVFEEKR